ncbi:Bifunctional arginine demethylase and lysyl-hydroxylase psr-1 [Diplonema papillatum]|nr:Bifunctional arginine demethylase and lysyl-hydroxylase psr-1 [Diplonema papillatum]|eukprot:gene10776-16596_t
MPGSESSKSSTLLFELCPDDLDSEDDVREQAAALRERDAATRCERTWQLEKDVVYGADGMGMPCHNDAPRRLKRTQPDWMPALVDEEAISNRGLEMARVAYTSLTLDAFNEGHVKCTEAHPYGRPVIAVGAAAEDDWAAMRKWSAQEVFEECYGGVPLHITEMCMAGEFGKPYPVRLPTRLYLQYAQDNEVDFPYYPFERDFDSEAAEDEGRAALLRDFCLPKFFESDVYALTPETRALFPKHKFVLVGGQRTGANMHQDPMGTSAWNTLVAGRKRWVFFPPNTDPSVLMTGEEPSEASATQPTSGYVMSMGKVTGRSPVNWWLDVYPKLVKPGADGTSLAQRLGMVECLQRPDETIYTPPYWFHAVLNVTGFTIAATGNTLSPLMLKEQWPHYRKQYPDDAEVLRREVLARGLLAPGDLPI